MMIAEALSAELKKIIKKGDHEGFLSLINEHGIKAADHLYGKRESSCWPLIQLILNDAFTTANTYGKLKMAHHLVQNGADLNDLRPYGASILSCLLDQHYYLKDTKAKYEVYVQTLVFALELTRQASIDVNATARPNDFGILDTAAKVYNFHEDHQNEELAKIARHIVTELLAKGAKLQKDKKEYTERIQLLCSD